MNPRWIDYCVTKVVAVGVYYSIHVWLFCTVGKVLMVDEVPLCVHQDIANCDDQLCTVVVTTCPQCICLNHTCSFINVVLVGLDLFLISPASGCWFQASKGSDVISSCVGVMLMWSPSMLLLVQLIALLCLVSLLRVY